MSLDDYNRGYQSGWTGIATGPPRSAAEFVGHWNGQDERRRASMPPVSSGASSGGSDNGHLVLAALFGAAAGGLYTMSFLGAIPGAVAGILAMIVLVWVVSRVTRLLVWIFGPIPVLKVALLGGAATVTARWVYVTQFDGLLLMGPVGVGMTGALTSLMIAAAVRITLAPFFLIARRAR